ncbi:chemotaxis protein CheA [Phenylobacterium sp.]|jgi:two-component system chemotaxis sensor kinase CheA|uniref:chemotaxis protein CheA n=1 Tax=Phenylobacterium sp. TaxID=1871053 RepID=UPI002F9221BD
MNEFVEQFLIECRELVEQGTHDLLALEERPGDRERLDGAFRAFHTLKGAAGIVDFEAMATALHAAEDVLSAARAGSVAVTPGLIGDCLSCLDQVVQWLDAMEVTGEPPPDAATAAAALVQRFGRAPAVQEAPAAQEAPSGDLGVVAAELLGAQLALLDDTSSEPSAGRTGSALKVAANVLRHAGRETDAVRLEEMLARPEALPHPRAAAAAIAGVLSGRLELAEGPSPAHRETAEPVARGLRIDIERVDALVNLTAELTVAKNALAHAAARARAGEDVAGLLRDQHAVLDRLVGELQAAVLNIRVLPMRQVFQRFPRLVREMVVSLGKPAHLLTDGEGVEADKAIVEALFEPLLHVIRNAVDHGIEDPAAREAAGKPPGATVRLSAARHGEHVIIEVADDGRGIDVERVRQKALEQGVAAPEALAAMSPAEVVELIFAPGFSTAAQVTGLSGRGVGMDAVRTAVERLGGRVDVASRAGEGTTVRFTLPFTVMMSRVMTVESAGQMFGIPLEAIVETIRLPGEAVSGIGAARAFVLRDRTLPLIDLAQLLGEGEASDLTAEITVVVVSAAGQLGGLRVDRLGERMDVMLKPMEGLLAGAFGMAGTTLMGDGRVLIVLDLQELLQ